MNQSAFHRLDPVLTTRARKDVLAFDHVPILSIAPCRAPQPPHTPSRVSWPRRAINPP